MLQLLVNKLVFQTFAGAKVLLFYDIRKRKGKKNACPPPARRDIPLKNQRTFPHVIEDDVLADKKTI